MNALRNGTAALLGLKLARVNIACTGALNGRGVRYELDIGRPSLADAQITLKKVVAAIKRGTYDDELLKRLPLKGV